MAAAHRRAGRAGALLRGVGLGQALPAVLAVAFLAGAGARRRSWLVRFGASSAGVVVVAYLPHVAAVGAGVVGYLPGYLREERYDQGGRYLVAGLLGLPVGATGRRRRGRPGRYRRLGTGPPAPAGE